MQDYNELIALREYTQTLERENEAKMLEQQTIYRQLQALDAEVKNMEKYYYQSKQLSKEIQLLKSVINTQQVYIAQTDQRQSQLEDIRHENLSLQEHLNICTQKINQLEFNNQNQSFKIQRLEHELTTLNRQCSKMQKKSNQILMALQEKQEENQLLRQKLQSLSREQNHLTEKNLHELAQNYEKIELVVLQRQETIQQMETYINQLEHQCQYLNQEFIKSQNHVKKLEYELKSLTMKRSTRVPEDNLSFLTDSISKVDLMRQNNRMLERIVKYEKENNTNNDNISQRHSYSECGEEKNTNSPNKLQMRIHTLKMENQNLLKTLAI